MKKYNYLLTLTLILQHYALATSSSANSTVTKKPISILKYADTGVGSPYVWGGSRWTPDNRKLYGADCSGFTQKAWGYPTRISVEKALPANNRLSTKEFMKAQDAGYPWKRIDKFSPSEDSRPGDAMVYRSNGKGHIFLVSKTDDSGVVTLEARGVNYGIGYSRKSNSYLKNKQYKLLRRK
jgi:hypothetical protein